MKYAVKWLFTLTAFLLTSCSASYNAKKYMNLESIPSDITKNGYTLLIMRYTDKDGVRYPEDINKQIEKYLATYPYPAVLVTRDELASPKYADVNKYRYFLQPSGVTRRITETSRFGVGLPETRTDNYREQFFTDRKEKKDYPLTGYKVRYFNYGVKVILGYLTNG